MLSFQASKIFPPPHQPNKIIHIFHNSKSETISFASNLPLSLATASLRQFLSSVQVTSFTFLTRGCTALCTVRALMVLIPTLSVTPKSTRVTLAMQWEGEMLIDDPGPVCTCTRPPHIEPGTGQSLARWCSCGGTAAPSSCSSGGGQTALHSLYVQLRLWLEIRIRYNNILGQSYSCNLLRSIIIVIHNSRFLVIGINYFTFLCQQRIKVTICVDTESSSLSASIKTFFSTSTTVVRGGGWQCQALHALQSGTPGPEHLQHNPAEGGDTERGWAGHFTLFSSTSYSICFSSEVFSVNTSGSHFTSLTTNWLNSNVFFFSSSSFNCFFSLISLSTCQSMTRLLLSPEWILFLTARQYGH